MRQLAAALWSVATVLMLGWLVSVQWSHPYCNQPTDGPGYAAYGFPLPFSRFGGVSSLELDFMPHVLALNVTLLSLLLYPLARAILSRTRRTGARIAVVSGGAVFTLVLSFHAALWIGLDRPVASIAPYSDSYWSYRPVALALDVRAYECTPSSYWFGKIER